MNHVQLTLYFYIFQYNDCLQNSVHHILPIHDTATADKFESFISIVSSSKIGIGYTQVSTIYKQYWTIVFNQIHGLV